MATVVLDGDEAVTGQSWGHIGGIDTNHYDVRPRRLTYWFCQSYRISRGYSACGSCRVA